MKSLRANSLCLLILLALSNASQVFAQPFRSNQDQIGQFVVEVFEDSRGRLWFGTMALGVACYDGKQLNYFTVKDGLAGNTVASVAEDHVGKIWFGTHTGATSFDGENFTSFKNDQGLSGAGCQILVTSQGHIWAATNDGAFRFDGESFAKFELPRPPKIGESYKWERGKVWAILEDRSGNIWFGRDGFGVCRYDGNAFMHLTKADGLCSNNISEIVQDKQGNMWFGCLSSDFPEPVQEGGLSRWNGSSMQGFRDKPGLFQNDIYSIACDRSGNVWIGANGHGVYRYDGHEFVLFAKTNRKDLTENFGVQSILQAADGRLWFGFSGGLFRLEEKELVNITKDGPW
ncbi:MAG: two-component regulator propeller domain-containing protein [Planctomycetota bacterium]